MINCEEAALKMMGAMAIAEDNIGCMTMLMEMEKTLSRKCYYMCQGALIAFDILGANAYRLWNDVCDRDVVATAELLFKLKTGAIPLHVVREELALPRASSGAINRAQCPYEPWMESFALDSIVMFGRDVLAPVPEKKRE